MSWRRTIVLGLLALGVSGVQAHAQVDHKTISGKDVEGRVRTVMERVDWKRSVEETTAAAKEAGKLALWIQLVGDLDGGL